jgi:hypothetical protein
MRFIALSAFLVVLVVLGGCSAIPGFAQLEAATVIGTDKTIGDHMISLSSGKNCSSIRKEKGLTYCEEDEPVIKQNIFCYKTLATVTYYDRPDPRRQRVDMNDHNRAR